MPEEGLVLSLSKLITALSENGIVHVGLEPPPSSSPAWWLQVNPHDLCDPRNTNELLEWEG